MVFGFVFGIVLVIGLVFLAVFLLRSFSFGRALVRAFKEKNVIVDGKKGSGKDLVFQYVIYKRRKEYYYANIDYGYNFNEVKISDISVYPNTYDDYIRDKHTIVYPKFAEKADIYISDCGIYLPSYMDSKLYKAYASLPIYYALSRHLSDHNIHCNIQNCSRLWKALREQADFFVHACGVRKLPFFLLVRVITYDNYDSAVRVLSPMKARVFNKFSKAETDSYRAQYGEIRSGYIIIPKSKIRYNTRAFRNKVYGSHPAFESPSDLLQYAKDGVISSETPDQQASA